MRHRFGLIEIDLNHRSVRSDGEPRHLEPQVFDVLSYLIQHRDRVVSKAELLDAVWGDNFVSDSALSSRIGSVRKAVGDDGTSQRVIRTLHGRGYRFVAQLDDLDAHKISTVQRDPFMIGRDAEFQRLGALLDTAHTAGVLLTGPAGIGKSLLARQIAGEFADGVIKRIHGHEQASELPLACLAHLLPSDVLDIADLDGDLARTRLLLRARTAMLTSAQGKPILLLIDDIDQIDALSMAIFRTLIEDASVFAVMTQRTDSESEIALDYLIRDGLVERMDLAPLSTVALERLALTTFSGPVNPRLPTVLVNAANGNPGVLNLLMQEALSSGIAYQHMGIWFLDEPISASPDMASLVDDRLRRLATSDREAIELLAIAGELGIDLGIELLGEMTIEALERDGFITVENDGERAMLRLSHPMLGEVVRGDMPALRTRRLKGILVEALEAGPMDQASDRLRIVRLRLDVGGEIDPEMILEAATVSLIEQDVATTENLLEMLQGYAPAARVLQLEAEVLFLMGQFRAAGTVLANVDLRELDSESAAFAIRRRATALYYGDGDQAAALKLLSSNFDSFYGESRATLQAYWIMLAALDGRNAAEAMQLGQQLLPSAAGFVRLEILASIGMACFILGRLEEALVSIAEFNERAALLPESLTWAGPDYARFVQIHVLCELGDLPGATQAIDDSIAESGLSSLGFVPIGAGRILWRSGRSSEVLSWLDPLIELAELIGLTSNSRPMQTTSVRAALELGDIDRARREAALLESSLTGEPSFGELDMIESIARVELAAGETKAARNRLLVAAKAAESVGNNIIEASLLGALTEAGGGAEAAGRLETLTDRIDGPVINLKLAHARASLGGPAELEVVARRYEALGFVRDAAAVRGQAMLPPNG